MAQRFSFMAVRARAFNYFSYGVNFKGDMALLSKEGFFSLEGWKRTGVDDRVCSAAGDWSKSAKFSSHKSGKDISQVATSKVIHNRAENNARVYNEGKGKMK